MGSNWRRFGRLSSFLGRGVGRGVLRGLAWPGWRAAWQRTRNVAPHWASKTLGPGATLKRNRFGTRWRAGTVGLLKWFRWGNPGIGAVGGRLARDPNHSRSLARMKIVPCDILVGPAAYPFLGAEMQGLHDLAFGHSLFQRPVPAPLGHYVAGTLRPDTVQLRWLGLSVAFGVPRSSAA